MQGIEQQAEPRQEMRKAAALTQRQYERIPVILSSSSSVDAV